MLSVQNLCAGYGGEDVLKGMSFSLRAGESLCVVGPNGCGKTTLLKALAGILPFRGEVALSGLSIRAMNRREIARQVALLGQMGGVYFSYTVYDTVMMGRYPHRSGGLLDLPSEEDKAVVLHCLDSVGLTGEKDREITRLSGGQLQRVFLARTLAQQPKILLLDEPSNHLDLKYQAELIEYLRRWVGQAGGAVVGVFHDLSLAIRLSERMLVLQDGRVRALGRADEIVRGGVLEEVYEMEVAAFMRESLRLWG